MNLIASLPTGNRRLEGRNLRRTARSLSPKRSPKRSPQRSQSPKRLNNNHDNNDNNIDNPHPLTAIVIDLSQQQQPPQRGTTTTTTKALAPPTLVPLHSNRKRRRVRFVDKASSIRPVEPVPADLWLSVADLQQCRLHDLTLYHQTKTAKTYLEECEWIQERLQSTATAPDPTEESSSCGTLSTAESSVTATPLDSYVTRILRDAVKHSPYRGLESGSHSKRRSRTQAIVRRVVEYFVQQQQQQQQKSKSVGGSRFLLGGKPRKRQQQQQAVDLAVFCQRQTRNHAQWARVLALADEMALRKTTSMTKE